VPAIGLVAGLVPAIVAGAAHAQVNIDQGKSPSEMFASDCATCHKGVRGLAVGKNSLMLSGFLREHYTASREEAASLAAYVLGAGGAEAAPKGEPKTAEPKIAEPKGQEPKEPKTAARPTGASAKSEEGPATAKPQPPAAEEATHEEPASPASPTGAAEQGLPPAPAVESAKPEPQETAPAAASPATSQPASAEAPSLEFGPTQSAAAPAQSQPSDSTPVPRDNIPD
jgi:hypothetical protein